MNTIRKNLTLLAMGVCAAFALTSAHAATLAGVPMKDHHAKLMQTCETCHGTATPTERPDGKACIGCHGTMDKIPTKPNRFDKFPTTGTRWTARPATPNTRRAARSATTAMWSSGRTSSNHVRD